MFKRHLNSLLLKSGGYVRRTNAINQTRSICIRRQACAGAGSPATQRLSIAGNRLSAPIAIKSNFHTTSRICAEEQVNKGIKYVEDGSFSTNPELSQERNEVLGFISEEVEPGNPENLVSGCLKNFRISDYLADRMRAIDLNYLYPIQAETFNSIYDGKDTVVHARPTQGKTLAYLVPLIEKLLQKPDALPKAKPSGSQEKEGEESEAENDKPKTKLLVLTSERRLARPMRDIVESLTDRLSIACAYIGAPKNLQEFQVRAGVDIVVGTPGRIRDLLTSRDLTLKHLQYLVIDDAEHMADLDHEEAVDIILKNTCVLGARNKNLQFLLFTAAATKTPWMEKLIDTHFYKDYENLNFIAKNRPVLRGDVEHFAIECPPSFRPMLISNLLKKECGQDGRGYIFCNTKTEGDRLVYSDDMKHKLRVMHRDMPYMERDAALKDFRDGSIKFLVLANITPKELNLPDVDVVLQLGPPKDADIFVRRANKAKKDKANGKSYILYQDSDFLDMNSLVVETNRELISSKSKQPTLAITKLNAENLIEKKVKDVESSLENAADDAEAIFSEAAMTLIKERGAESAMAAALAVIAGCGIDEQKSLLTKTLGFTTYKFTLNNTNTPLMTALDLLRQRTSCGHEIVDCRFSLDKKSLIFDIPAKYNAEFQRDWISSVKQKTDALYKLELAVESDIML